jgi:hypothetical protein
MKIEYHPNQERGVTNLMYVGDDGLDHALGETPLAQRLPSILIALGLVAVVYYVATKPSR